MLMDQFRDQEKDSSRGTGPHVLLNLRYYNSIIALRNQQKKFA